jgi:hypothetical protein
MVYPSHFYSGEFGIDDPNANPRDTVDQALADFQGQLRGKKALLVPWLQDFSLGRTYTAADVQSQIEAARARGAAGRLARFSSGPGFPGRSRRRSSSARSAWSPTRSRSTSPS